MDRLITMGVLPAKFTRCQVDSLAAYATEYKRIVKQIRYGTIVLDTFGQLTSWISEEQFVKDAKIADKQSQIVWGHIRDRIRNQLIALQGQCDLLLLTAHEREYPPASHKYSPRCHPGAVELASMSIRLVRDANKKLPDAEVYGARLPFFPPRIKDFSIASLLQYVEKPADWADLKEGEKLEPEPPAPPMPGYADEDMGDAPETEPQAHWATGMEKPLMQWAKAQGFEEDLKGLLRIIQANEPHGQEIQALTDTTLTREQIKAVVVAYVEAEKGEK
jgi:hypothetical protein